MQQHFLDARTIRRKNENQISNAAAVFGCTDYKKEKRKIKCQTQQQFLDARTIRRGKQEKKLKAKVGCMGLTIRSEIEENNR